MDQSDFERRLLDTLMASGIAAPGEVSRMQPADLWLEVEALEARVRVLEHQLGMIERYDG